MRPGNKILILGVFLFAYFTAFAGGEFPVIGSRQAGMGRSSVALTDFWNLQNNQAGIALIDKFGAGIYYESQFSINQLSTKSAAFLAPTKIGVLGLTFNYFGYNLYNDMKIGLVYARSFGQYLRIGIQLDYIQTTLGDDYGSKSNVTFEIGLQSDITEQLTIGAWVFNPLQVKLAEYDDEKIPAIFKLGIAWEITNGFIATLEAEKNTAVQPILIRGGLEYGIHDKFFFRGGFSTQKEIFSMGFGFKVKVLRFDISAVMHETLGFSPQASLIFQF
ncbi:MAG: hypothetical protein V2I62_02740 [Bacteroidales bacterium]|jgi:hypothetical protein|nr:hypothetical protein [Bacteroidales bacterium]